MSGDYWFGLEVASADRVAFREMADRYLGGNVWDEADTINGHAKVIKYDADHALQIGLQQMVKDIDCPPFAYRWDIENSDCDTTGLFSDGQLLVEKTNGNGEIVTPLSLNTNWELNLIGQTKRFDEYVKACRLAKLN